jgi:hypothetical protein
MIDAFDGPELMEFIIPIERGKQKDYGCTS